MGQIKSGSFIQIKYILGMSGKKEQKKKKKERGYIIFFYFKVWTLKVIIALEFCFAQWSFPFFSLLSSCRNQLRPEMTMISFILFYDVKILVVKNQKKERNLQKKNVVILMTRSDIILKVQKSQWYHWN